MKYLKCIVLIFFIFNALPSGPLYAGFNGGDNMGNADAKGKYITNSPDLTAIGVATGTAVKIDGSIPMTNGLTTPFVKVSSLSVNGVAISSIPIVNNLIIPIYHGLVTTTTSSTYQKKAYTVINISTNTSMVYEIPGSSFTVSFIVIASSGSFDLWDNVSGATIPNSTLVAPDGADSASAPDTTNYIMITPIEKNNFPDVTDTPIAIRIKNLGAGTATLWEAFLKLKYYPLP